VILRSKVGLAWISHFGFARRRDHEYLLRTRISALVQKKKPGRLTCGGHVICVAAMEARDEGSGRAMHLPGACINAENTVAVRFGIIRHWDFDWRARSGTCPFLSEEGPKHK